MVFEIHVDIALCTTQIKVSTMRYQNINVDHQSTALNSNIRNSRTTQIRISTMHYSNINVVILSTARNSKIRYSWPTQIKLSTMRNQNINNNYL